MDIRTLPKQERDIYNGLKKHYALHFTTVRAGKYKLRVLKPSDIEEVLTRSQWKSEVGRFPFWAKLWESSIVLTHQIVVEPHVQNKRLLDLGAGLGLCGIAAAVAGFEVVLNETEQSAIDFQQVSVAANKGIEVEHLKFSWEKPPDIGQFDVITGAEILADEDLLDPLLDMCNNYLNDKGIIYLAHDIKRKTLPQFLNQAESYFKIGTKKQSFRTTDKVVDVLINRLQRK